ncbi:hypothetical protein AB833_28550 [Chromatiales bacterium (ex Bugula neritina AB1)]|nr:hypothetical protein AB833_28550 [Chromatiales bacterium (ex Bugula neritina AB1)]
MGRSRYPPVRKALNLKVGDKVVFIARESGEVMIFPATREVNSIKGMIQKPVDPVSLVASDRRNFMQTSKAGTAIYRLFEQLPMMPRFTFERVRKLLDTSFPTATAAVKVLEDLDIVTETTGQRTNRQYSYIAYIESLIF